MNEHDETPFWITPLNGGKFKITDTRLFPIQETGEGRLLLQYELDEYNSKFQVYRTIKFIGNELVYEDLIEPDVELIKQDIWEKIKQVRYTKCHSGVYVKSVDKWFHSDTNSRQQYIFLRTLPVIPDNTEWKTMDNSFVVMTKELLDEISLAMFSDEQKNFSNAESHKVKLFKSKSPFEYDFSEGWTKTYDDEDTSNE